MLQKLENSFLSILRCVVLAAAALALLGFVIAGLGGLKLAKSEPVPQTMTFKLSSQQMIDSLTDRPAAQASAPASATTGAAAASDHKADYDKVYQAIAKYVATISGRPADVDRNKVVAVVDQRSRAVEDEALRQQYLAGMGPALDKVLGNADLIKHARQTQDPYAMIDKAMDAYTEQFNGQMAQNEASNAAARARYQADHDDGMRSLYYAAGLFGAFLLIVFISIIIKIERNLRYLAHIENKQA